MMYQQKFVAVLKVNGKILREQGEDVYMPFGSEYSILLKNLSNQKALIKITIDGRETTGYGLIIRPNSEIELERFIDNDDLKKGYRFKFIQKTKKIQDHRGDKADDGLIRVEWWFEQELPALPPWNIPLRRSQNDNDNYWDSKTGMTPQSPVFTCSFNSCESNVSTTSTSTITKSIIPTISEIEIDNSPLEDEGITVEGSDSHQIFTQGYIGVLEPKSHVIVFNLHGYEGNKKPINKPVYVDSHVQCKQCGSKWKSSIKFCGECGARLIS